MPRRGLRRDEFQAKQQAPLAYGAQQYATGLKDEGQGATFQTYQS